MRGAADPVPSVAVALNGVSRPSFTDSDHFEKSPVVKLTRHCNFGVNNLFDFLTITYRNSNYNSYKGNNEIFHFPTNHTGVSNSLLPDYGADRPQRQRRFAAQMTVVLGECGHQPVERKVSSFSKNVLFRNLT